jgi:hypothetical protein
MTFTFVNACSAKKKFSVLPRESVSFTDMKTGINILGTLQFRLVMHMWGVQRPAQRRLLDHIPMSRVSSGDWGSNDQ